MGMGKKSERIVSGTAGEEGEGESQAEEYG